jgi:CBS domain-containing protein
MDQLETASAVDWLTRYADLVDTAIVKRVLRLTGADVASSCWCFHGASGRGESLTQAAPPIGVIGPADATGVSAALAECGYLSPGRPECGSVEEWQGRFRAWVSDPIESDRYGAQPMFDLRPVAGPERPFEQVKVALRDAIAQEKYFVRLLAHDCLANLPPVTFFRDQVVAESGEQTSTFELDRSTLQPLVDVARVFAAAAGRVLGASSLDRLQAASNLMPDHEAIFREAAEALRVVLYLQARVGIRQGTAGSELPPSLLSGYDRRVLKTCFRSILGLLEFTAECSWMVGK